MTDLEKQTGLLLDAIEANRDDVSDRSHRRLQALARMESQRLIGQAHPAAVRLRMRGEDSPIRFIRSRPVVASLVTRLVTLGFVAEDWEERDSDATSLGRMVLRLSRESAETLTLTLGQFEATLAARFLERRLAVRVLNRIMNSDLVARPIDARHWPDIAPAPDAIRRLTQLYGLGLSGRAIACLLGQTRLLSLLRRADSSVAAAIRLRLDPSRAAAAADNRAWLPVARTVLEDLQ